MTDTNIDSDLKPDSETSPIADYLHCSVCLEPIVCPYSFGCGHNIDAQCFVQLRKHECPKCRFKFHDTKRYGVNLMLEGLLRDKIPNYDELAQKQMKYVKSIGLLKSYRKSPRYKNILSLCDKFITDHNHTARLTDLYEHVSKEMTATASESEVFTSDSALEVRYVLSLHNYGYITTTDGDDYVVELNDEMTLGAVLRELKDKCDKLTIIKLLTWTFEAVDEVANSGLDIQKTPFISDGDNGRLIDYILALGDKINIPNNRSESATVDEITDSESENESENESDGSDMVFDLVIRGTAL